MKEEKGKNILIVSLIIVMAILVAFIILLATNTISINIGKNVNNEGSHYTVDNNTGEELNEDSKSNNEDNSYDENKSYIGYYQVLNDDFVKSKTDTTQYTKIDLEYNLMSNGDFEIAYCLYDNGNIVTKSYKGTYDISKILDSEIDGDHYVALNLSYSSQEALNDEAISLLSTNVTYNPATHPVDPNEQRFPQLLSIRGPLGKMHAYRVDKSEIKYLK